MSDLRWYLGELEKQGELKTVDKVMHWDLEAPAVCAMTNRVGGPAVHFRKVRGYPEGYTLAGSLFTGPGTANPHPRTPWTRLAIALGLDKNIGYEELMDKLIERRNQPLPPTRVATGSCKEIVLSGEQVDLLAFPFPKLHQEDGGRYINGCITIAKDPSGPVHWGSYRWMIQNKNTLVGYFAPQGGAIFPPQSPLASIHAGYEARNQVMPLCIALGGDPAAFLAANLRLPPGTNEAEIAGGLRQDPLELVKAETNDLLVPAQAEIIIEGEVRPGERAMEGPFPGWTRYGQAIPQPVLHVKAITHRRNPILPFIVESKVSDSLALASVLGSMELTRAVRQETNAPIRWLNLPVESCLGLLVVSTMNRWRGFVYFLSEFFHMQKSRWWFDKLIFVEGDVRPIDLDEVMRDIGAKCHPLRNIHVEGSWGPLSPVVNYATPEERERGTMPLVTIDTTWPAHWEPTELPKRVTFEGCYPRDIQDRVIARWKEYGLKGQPVRYEVPPQWVRGLPAPQQ
jgi:4-hydroxy-3-polyprenylbenzoate decarboxylase